jgi:hypothetical protein
MKVFEALPTSTETSDCGSTSVDPVVAGFGGVVDCGGSAAAGDVLLVVVADVVGGVVAVDVVVLVVVDVVVLVVVDVVVVVGVVEVVGGVVVDVVDVDGGISTAAMSRGTDCGRPVTSAPASRATRATNTSTSSRFTSAAR